MKRSTTPARSLGDLADIASDLICLEDLRNEVLPTLQRAFNTSACLLYRVREGSNVVDNHSVSHRRSGRVYFQDFYSKDPLQIAMRDTQAPIFHASAHRPGRRWFGCPSTNSVCNRA
jgi:hypothetical protein